MGCHAHNGDVFDLWLAVLKLKYRVLPAVMIVKPVRINVS